MIIIFIKICNFAKLLLKNKNKTLCTSASLCSIKTKNNMQTKPEIILELEKEYNIVFEEVELEEIKKYEYEQSLQYYIDLNGEITGLKIIKYPQIDFSFLAGLKNITILYLWNNEITDISMLKDLKKIEILGLSNNKITDISCLKELKNLSELYLSRNRINDVSSLKDLEKITTLYLIYNNITFFPEWITDLKTDFIWTNTFIKKTVNLYGTPIENVPIEIIEEGKQAIKQYFEEEKTDLKDKKIKEIELKNLKIFENIKIDFSENVTIILGNNGYGKSTLLEALVLNLLKDKSKYLSNDLKKYIKINKTYAEINVLWDKETKRNCNIYESSKSTSSGSCGSNLAILAYGVNIFTRDSGMNYDKICYEIIDGNNDLQNVNSILKDTDNEFFNPLLILRKFEEIEFHDSDNSEIAKNLKEVLLEKLKFLLPQDIEIVKHKLMYFFKDTTGEKIEFSQLSEGYKNAILLLTDILIKIMSMRNTLKKYDSEITDSNIFDRAFGFLAIDEFDRHLHPKWQLVYINKLQQVLPKMQLLLTTHNPISLQSAVGGTAIELVIENQKIIAKYNEIKVNNILSIINKFFTNNIFDYNTQNDLNEFSEILKNIYNEELDIKVIYQKDFKELVNKLYNFGGEIQTIVSTQLSQLNSTLKELKMEEFVL